MPDSPGLLFVSYSHLDTKAYANTFLRYLQLLLRSRPELGFSETDIFFDQDRLKAGDDWNPSIAAALERAYALVLLVSPNSLSSRYCVRTELAAAVARGIPIFPVVLCECPWEGQPLPGDPSARTLGSLQALPKNDDFMLVPVRNWGNRNAVWNAVVADIGESLRKRMAGSLHAVANTVESLQRSAPPLLPYFCNQDHAERGFNKGVVQWRQSALVVLVKGTLDDRAPQFWARLRHKNLSDLAKLRQYRLLEQRPMRWPSALDGARLSKSLLDDLRMALADALTGNPYTLIGEGELTGVATALQAAGGVLPLIACLPQEPPKAQRAGLRALLDLLEAAPPGAPLERLVLAVVVEDESTDHLVRGLALDSYTRTRVVELDRLKVLLPNDVIDWHRNYEVQRWCALDEHELSHKVFAGESQLRMAQFETRVKPLLAVSGRIS